LKNETKNEYQKERFFSNYLVVVETHTGRHILVAYIVLAFVLLRLLDSPKDIKENNN
jgi:heme/copper-type cytochrome/quinol oxidase subunit 3